ncbi:PLAC8 family [Fragilaria crotonensis]|nr:PLAC8 family [Fragilaria crotonensis]
MQSSPMTGDDPESVHPQPRTVLVVAPASLEAGFTFEATYENKSFVVVVPDGGVKEGQEFQVPYPETVIDIPDDDEVQRLLHDDFGVPKGAWRASLCSCCDVCTQATFWMALFIPPILYAQILTRLRLTWKAEEGPPEETAMTFNRIVMTVIFVLAFGVIPFVVYATFLVAILCFMYIGMKLRRFMRTKYEIPPGILGRIHPTVDDVCCILFCTCCSGIQMARHTHDDKEWPGSCCTTNGLEYGAPEIV